MVNRKRSKIEVVIWLGHWNRVRWHNGVDFHQLLNNIIGMHKHVGLLLHGYVCLSPRLPFCSSVPLSISLSVHLSSRPSVCLSFEYMRLPLFLTIRMLYSGIVITSTYRYTRKDWKRNPSTYYMKFNNW